jgi:hypothetical protein
MYYSYSCPVCGTLFYTYSASQQAASQTLYNGIEQHILNYNEENSGSDTLDHPDKMYEDVETIYEGLTPLDAKPEVGTEL